MTSPRAVLCACQRKALDAARLPNQETKALVAEDGCWGGDGQGGRGSLPGARPLNPEREDRRATVVRPFDSAP